MKRIVFALLLMAYPAYATICAEDNISSCEELGYTSSSCNYGGLACPFDMNKWLCPQWSCEDGRYKSEADSPDCEEVTYKGLTCYLCAEDCRDDEFDSETCWDGKMADFISNCVEQGYVDTPTSCTNYLICPSDINYVRCLD